MKQSLYKVPDGYFEKAEAAAIDRARGIRKTRIALICILPIFLAVAYLEISHPTITPAQDYSVLDNCDIFLEVFEY